MENISCIFLNIEIIDIVNCVLNFFMVIGTALLFYGVIISKKSFEKNMDLARISKAVELTNYYKDNILCYIFPIKDLFIQTKIIDVLNRHNNVNKEKFTRDELDTIYSTEDINEIKKIIDSVTFAQVAVNVNASYNLELNLSIEKRMNENTKKEEVLYDPGYVSSVFLYNVVCKVLNNMEYFSAYFIQGIAEESCIFESIHQTYIELVELLYYQISYNNTVDVIPYYQKTVALYNIWKKRKKEKLQKEKIDCKGKVLD